MREQRELTVGTGRGVRAEAPTSIRIVLGIGGAFIAAALLGGCGSAAHDAHSIGDKAAQTAKDAGNAVKTGGEKAGNAVGGK
jgi:hypothetical protein